MEGKGLLPGTELSIWATEAGSTNSAWLWVCAVWFCYFSGLTLRSFIYEDVGEPAPHPTETAEDYHLHTSLDLESPWTLYREFAIASRSSTERLGDFLKA